MPACPRILLWSPLHTSAAHAENIAVGGMERRQQHSVLRHFGRSLPRFRPAPRQAPDRWAGTSCRVAWRRRGIIPIANPTRQPSAPLRLLEPSDGSILLERAVAGVAGKADKDGRPLVTLEVPKSRLRAGWPRPDRLQAWRFSAGDDRHLRFLPEVVMEVLFLLYLRARSRRQ
jgi:hypothetical protein